MNYEEFSPEAQKVINDFRGLIENIKSGKDLGAIKYYPFNYSTQNTCMLPYVMYPVLSRIDEVVYAYCFVSRLSSTKTAEVFLFLKEKNYFLPKFSSYEDFKQNKHKYPFIKE